MRISQENENSERQKDRQSPQTARTKASDHRLKFPKSARIRSKGHYQRLYQEGRKCSGEMVGAALRFGSKSGPKLGITVSKRHGKAHERNLFKRRVREAFRHTSFLLPHEIEINVFPRLPIEKVTKAGVEADILRFVGTKT